MSRYNGSLMDTLVHSAVAGAGLSLGRDTYRKTRDNIIPIILAVVALAGTGYGVWNMTRGHDRSAAGAVFRTYFVNGVIVVVSFTVFMTVFLSMTAGGGDAEEPSRGVSDGAVFVGICIQLALALAGAAFGISQRGRRLEAIEVDRHNKRFLDSNGFRDVGGRDETMLGPHGEELVLEDFRADAVVFKVKGRRAVRAKIILDHTGRMVSYVPA